MEYENGHWAHDTGFKIYRACRQGRPQAMTKQPPLKRLVITMGSTSVSQYAIKDFRFVPFMFVTLCFGCFGSQIPS